MGKKGRMYAQKYLSRDMSVSKYIKIFEKFILSPKKALINNENERIFETV